MKSTTLKLLAALVLLPVTAKAHEAPTRRVVVDDDSGRNVASRPNEINTNVVAELQKSLILKNIALVMEDMVTVKLGFSYNEDGTKQELIQKLNVADETTDADVRNRLGFVSARSPNIQEMSMTRKLNVRVPGQINDLKTLRALPLFKVGGPDTLTLPKIWHA